MDSLPENKLLQFNSDTLENVRKECGFDNPEKLKEFIDTLFKWIQNQDHFVKKNYFKDYLERVIIRSQGSLEMAKRKLDLISTLKTLLPKYFEPFDMDNSYILKIVHCSFLPKMTEDHSRIFMLKNRGQRYDPGILDFLKYFIMVNEYNSAHDYASGWTAIFDYTENNLKALVRELNFVELQQALTIILEGYSVKVNGIHFVTPSKLIDTFVAILKNALNPRIGKLIQVHRKVETLYKYVPKDLLPIEYGGKEKPLKELSDNMLETLKSEEYTNYYNMMKRAGINVALKKMDALNDDYMGMPGSLRIFNID